MDKKPNVFPTEVDLNEAMKQANETGDRIARQAEEEVKQKTPAEMSAQEQMNANTMANLEKQIARRDALLAKKRAEENGELVEETQTQQVQYAPSIESKYVAKNGDVEQEEIDLSKIYEKLSQPQKDVPYDALKLPSGGLVYKNHKSTIDVAYLNATDEDIITNPNLLQSGKFLEVLINRKMMNTRLKYRDLHVGDRNAIMLWLRSTGYGSEYNITLSDPKDPEYKEFTATIDLDKLPMKPLGAKPNSDGYFEFILPLSKDRIIFKLLTVGDVEDIEEHISDMSNEITDISSFTLKRQIVSYNKPTNERYHPDNEITESEAVARYVERIRLGDVRSLRKYIEKIESGMDMNITVGTPGGGSVKTFLPLNLSFFWPDIEL